MIHFLLYSLIVLSKKVKLEIEARIDMPVVDIIDDKHRLKAIEEGLVRSISKGLYEQKAYLLDK